MLHWMARLGGSGVEEPQRRTFISFALLLEDLDIQKISIENAMPYAGPINQSFHWLFTLLQVCVIIMIIIHKKAERCSAFEKEHPTLAGVAQWTECRPANQRVAGSIPVRAHAWGAGQAPWTQVRERQPRIDVSLLLFLPPFPSKNK